MEFETLTKCPSCQALKIKLLLKANDLLSQKPGEFFLSKCQQCGLVFQNPRIKEKDIGFYYESIDYFKEPKRTNPEKEKQEFANFFSFLKVFLKQQILRNHLGYGKQNIFWLLIFPFKKSLLAKSYPYFIKGGKLLEVGCSNGSFLEELQSLGWQARGVEMSERSAQFAREKRNLEVENKRLEECNFKENEFDAIIMNMVLEHLYSPFESLKKITQWLKPEGQLIFSLPYFQGFEFWAFKEFTYGLQLPTHQTFFKQTILRAYLKHLGFKKIKFYFQAFDRDLVVSSQYVFQSGKRPSHFPLPPFFFKLLGYNKIIRLFFVKPLIFFLALINKTSRITVRAVKK